MDDYLEKYYSDIKDVLTEDNIKVIKDSYHYNRYLLWTALTGLKRDIKNSLKSKFQIIKINKKVDKHN